MWHGPILMCHQRQTILVNFIMRSKSFNVSHILKVQGKTGVLSVDNSRNHDSLDMSRIFSVVHCSAGIGRTGTLCLVNSTLKKLGKDPQNRNRMIDIYQIVDIVFHELVFLRQFRLGLIQVKSIIISL